jgi:chromate reductase
LETSSPPSDWASFRSAVSDSDALLFVTPEYNRTVPALIKNAVDVASRPYGKSCFTGKPAAVISASPGKHIFEIDIVFCCVYFALHLFD